MDDKSADFGVASYDILGTTIEDIFLDLMRKEDSIKALADGQSDATSLPPQEKVSSLSLASGRPVSFFRQALTIFYKRILIARRSWLTPLLTIAIAVCGSCIPLLFIKDLRQTCIKRYRAIDPTPLFVGRFPLAAFALSQNDTILVQNPPNLLRTLINLPLEAGIVNTPDQSAWEGYIAQNYRSIIAGGVSYDATSGAVTYAWEGAWPSILGPAMQNFATNLLYRRAFNASGNAAAGSTSIINTNFGTFPRLAVGSFIALKWMIFFGAVMVGVKF